MINSFHQDLYKSVITCCDFHLTNARYIDKRVRWHERPPWMCLRHRIYHDFIYIFLPLVFIFNLNKRPAQVCCYLCESVRYIRYIYVN